MARIVDRPATVTVEFTAAEAEILAGVIGELTSEVPSAREFVDDLYTVLYDAGYEGLTYAVGDREGNRLFDPRVIEV